MVTYSPEKAEEITTLIACGDTITNICSRPDMPTAMSFYGWCEKFPEVGIMYARARALRANSRADKIDSICEQMFLGQIEPHAARIIIDAQKWQAAKDNPRQYGDKQQVEVTGKDGEPLSMRLIEIQQRLLRDITPEPLTIENDNSK